MKWGGVSGILLAAAGALPALASCDRPPDPPTEQVEERFYRFPAGTRWIFKAEFGAEKRKATYTITGLEGETRIVEYELFKLPDDLTAFFDEAWYVQDGFIVHGSVFDGITPMWRIYKIGSKEGDRWETLPGVGQATHMGFSRVTVPAGTFESVVHIRLTDEDAKVHDFYYAPRVGLVKSHTEGAGGSAHLELMEVERP